MEIYCNRLALRSHTNLHDRKSTIARFSASLWCKQTICGINSKFLDFRFQNQRRFSGFRIISKRLCKISRSCRLLGVLVLLLGDLMASATWLANPSLLIMFLLMVPGNSSVISLKGGRCLLVLPFAETDVYKLLGQISSHYCLWVGGWVYIV